MSEPDGASLRIDRWLWFARLARTRSLAARACVAGRVAIDGALVTKPHHPVRIGDRITVTQERMQRHLLIVALGKRRGPAVEARHLYREPEPPVMIAEAEADWTPLLDEENRA